MRTSFLDAFSIFSTNAIILFLKGSGFSSIALPALSLANLVTTPSTDCIISVLSIVSLFLILSIISLKVSKVFCCSFSNSFEAIFFPISMPSCFASSTFVLVFFCGTLGVSSLIVGSFGAASGEIASGSLFRFTASESFLSSLVGSSERSKFFDEFSEGSLFSFSC